MQACTERDNIKALWGPLHDLAKSGDAKTPPYWGTSTSSATEITSPVSARSCREISHKADVWSVADLLNSFRSASPEQKKCDDLKQCYHRVYSSLSFALRTPDHDFQLKKEFETLVESWRRETGLHSSLSRKFTHPAYVRIIGFGVKGLPFILAELQNRPGHWFYALKYIAGKDVAKGAASFEQAREMWLDWGRQNFYI